jgi:hypothetical protein
VTSGAAAATLQRKATAIANVERVIAPVHVTFCRCGVESKRHKIPSVNCSATTLAILAVLSASLTLAEDFKTINGKIYKDATIRRVEADGIVLRTKAGVSKIYFIELPKDIQGRFHFDPAKAVAAQREREPINVDAQKDESRQSDEGGGWVAALPISAAFLRLLGVGALISTGVVVAIVRSRY